MTCAYAGRRGEENRGDEKEEKRTKEGRSSLPERL